MGVALEAQCAAEHAATAADYLDSAMERLQAAARELDLAGDDSAAVLTRLSHTYAGSALTTIARHAA